MNVMKSHAVRKPCVSGRVARAGRTGTAHSLIGPDEVSYVLDLHLFLGRPLKLVESGVVLNGEYQLILCQYCLMVTCVASFSSSIVFI